MHGVIVRPCSSLEATGFPEWKNCTYNFSGYFPNKNRSFLGFVVEEYFVTVDLFSCSNIHTQKTQLDN